MICNQIRMAAGAKAEDLNMFMLHKFKPQVRTTRASAAEPQALANSLAHVGQQLKARVKA